MPPAPATAVLPPAEGSTQQQVQLSVEEYEALRLIDYLGLTQQEAAAQMQVSRSALQSTYAEARKKLAMFLVEGRQLQIQGGEYTLCPFRSGGAPVQSKCSLRGGCKGVQSMKVAICYENGLVFQHFGHTQQFKVYDIADGKISHSEVVDTNGQGHGALADVLKDLGVDALICGGIGPRRPQRPVSGGHRPLSRCLRPGPMQTPPPSPRAAWPMIRRPSAPTMATATESTTAAAMGNTTAASTAATDPSLSALPRNTAPSRPEGAR